MDDKKVSKLISYWLRHAPGDAGLVLDNHGWTSTDALLNALSKRGIALSRNDLQALATRTDKVRWETGAGGGRIRATHGHSVDVSPDPAKRAAPPPVLYHGTPAAAVETILREGLRPMSRQAVHLAATPSEALAVGRRRGKAILLEVDAETMHRSRAVFYQTSEGVWLTTSVPPNHLSPAPWFRIGNEAIAALKDELIRELDALHPLYLLRQTLTPLWQSRTNGDVLFADATTGCYYNVSLGLCRGTEGGTYGPAFKTYPSFMHWLTTGLSVDQAGFYFG